MIQIRLPNLPYERLLLLALILALAACGDSESPTPTRTPPPTAPVAVTSTPAPLASLLNLNLLTAPGAVIQCDSSENAEAVCKNADGIETIQTAVPADGYARLSVRFDAPAQPLGGHEILTLHAQKSGNVSPNIYFVEEDGTRTFRPLNRFSLESDWHTIHIPLREFVDAEGNRPELAALREIQLVFEWADMQGEFSLDSLAFAPLWDEQIAPVPVAPEIRVPDGFVIEAVAGESHNPTQLETPTADSLLVSEQAGRIWWYWDDDRDGYYERRRLYDTGYTEVVGLLYDPVDGAVWIGGRGQLWRTLDRDADGNRDGVADVKELRLDGLPWGRHQNNGLAWNPAPDPFSGEPAHAWLYFGLGSQGDLDGSPDETGGLSATVLRFPRDGQGQESLEVISRGNRNAYDVVWAAVPVGDESHWALFASENGPDFNDAPDEANHIRWGRHYGFPDQFGMANDDRADPDGADPAYTSPVLEFPAHASADGLAFVTAPEWPPAYRTLYVSLFGEIFGGERVGHTVERVTLSPVTEGDDLTFRGESSTFIDGLDRPLAMTTDSQGRLLVADYATGVVYRVQHTGE